jgi:hypothetical protein
MGDSHRHLAITEDEWAAFVDDLHVTLTKFQVPPAEATELVAIVESTRDAIVVDPVLRSERVASAVGEGAMAVRLVQERLQHT